MSRLELQGVEKSFGSFSALRHVSLEIPSGKFVCFLGPSGCGKTTLLRVVAGLETPTGGRILLDGRDITRTPVHKRNFAMVFQTLALFPHLSVEENIGYSLRLKGMRPQARRKRVRELLELIRLPDAGGRTVAQLSGGQRQRVAIARALAQDPLLFLMDEPLSALDAKLRDHMQVELRLLQRQLDITAILVTHDQREAMTIADLIVVMADGVVHQVGAPLEIYRSPANRFVASFIGQSNLLEARVVDRRTVRWGDCFIDVDDVPPAADPGDRVAVSVRPESIRIVGPRDRTGGDIEGDLIFTRDVGASLEVRVQCNGQEIVTTAAPQDRAQIPSSGRVAVRIDKSACRVLAH